MNGPSKFRTVAVLVIVVLRGFQVLKPDDRPASMDGSPAALPSDLFQSAVFDDHGHGRIPIGYRQHFFGEFHIVLRIKVLEWDVPLGVKRSRLCAMWTAWLRIYLDFQSLLLP